ncbi:MAG: hypothetical protein COA45_02055 [Zetaproteobacteria bacterium]|nr:MAG: hypothetical protein COA45_02055 [Zetaproteobacteria bacterium]
MGLSFLAQTTPLWVKKVNGQPIVICSAFGTKTIFIDKSGQKVPAPPNIKNHCVMCLAAATDYNIPTTIQIRNRQNADISKQRWFFASMPAREQYPQTAHAIRAPPYTS